MELMKVNDLEDKIMKVWDTTDDIDLLLNWISDHVLIYDVESDADEDELMNLLIGIRSLHHQRCDALFRGFEKVLANSKGAENKVAASLARATDGEDFTTYASVTAYTGDVNISPPEWT